MSILVNVKMPESCSACPYNRTNLQLIGEHYCLVTKRKFQQKYSDDKPLRQNWCPLIEIPEPHGDLIDRNVAIESIEWKWAGKEAFEALKAVPTVIPATGEET